MTSKIKAAFFILFVLTVVSGLWIFPLVPQHNIVIVAALLYWTVFRTYAVFTPDCRPIPPEEPPQMMNIEMLRYLFMLGIIFFHCDMQFHINPNSFYGVEFFFTLSGFFFQLTYRKDKTLLDFIKSKLVRFLPLMVFGSLICCLFEKSVSISKLLSSFLFFHAMGVADRHCYLYPSWYLAVLFWVLVFYFQLRKSAPKSVFLLITGVLTFLAYVTWAAEKYTFDPVMQPHFLPIGVFRGVGGVGLGILTAEAYQKFKNVTIENKLFYGIFEIFIFFYALSAMFFQKLFPDFEFLLFFTFSVLIVLFAANKGFLSNYCNSTSVFVFSKYNFATYMVHCFFAERLLPYLIERHAVINEYKTTAMFLTFAGSILLGIFAYHFVERPGSAIMEKWLGKMKRPLQPAAGKRFSPLKKRKPRKKTRRANAK